MLLSCHCAVVWTKIGDIYVFLLFVCYAGFKPKNGHRILMFLSCLSLLPGFPSVNR
jgi:hypothetical protein